MEVGNDYPMNDLLSNGVFFFWKKKYFEILETCEISDFHTRLHRVIGRILMR